MKRIILLLLTTFFCIVASAQEVTTSNVVAQTEQSQKTTVNCRVVDAQTGERLPYVNVYMPTTGKGTITNHEGEFTLTAESDEVIRVSFIGYEKRFFKASQMPKVIKMKPWENSMAVVEVKAAEALLVEASKRLYKQLKKNRKKQTQYFFRMNTAFQSQELTEAFVTARSMGNLREMNIIKGRHGRKTQAGLSSPLVSNMNFHHPLEVGPWIAESNFWIGTASPLRPDLTINYLNSYYNTTLQTLKDSTGTQYHCFYLKKKENVKSPIVTGKLYMDHETLQPLRFEGEVENASVVVTKGMKKIVAPINLIVHITFNNEDGYTKVGNIATLLSSGDLKSQSVLFNVDDIDFQTGEHISDNMASGKRARRKVAKGNGKVAENMLKSISDAGFDELLWKNSDIIKRTDEEQLALAVTQDVTQGSSTALLGSVLNDDDKNRIGTLGDSADTRLKDMVNRLTRFGHNIPQEKVYLHMDNTCYFLGDTIWYAAYTYNTSSGMPSTISGTLYVELYNQDGYLVERQLVEMQNGRGHGNFVLSKENYGGYYELRAYTRWQLNWGLFEHKNASVSKEWFVNKDFHGDYYRDYEKLYSRVFPVYDAPEKEGEYIENMTLRPMRRYFKKDPHKRKLSLTLYPEGGNVVAGLPCRVAYEALWDDGKEAELVDRPARGIIEVTPQKGEKHKVEFVDRDGTKVSASLPKPEKEGVALRAHQTDEEWVFDLQLSHGLSKDSLGITIMQQGVVQKVAPVLDSLMTLGVAKTDLPEGVNQITVFDVQGRILADRLFFNTLPPSNTQQKTITNFQPIHIGLAQQKTDNDSTATKQDVRPLSEVTFGAYDPIYLNVKSVPKTPISISVRDAAHSDRLNDNATMRVEMLLSSEIKGFVANPQYYFERDDEEHRQALDLLMMIQGWRRFNWREMAVKGTFELTQKAEKTPIITGRVIKNPEYEEPDYSDKEFMAVASTAGMHITDVNRDADNLAAIEAYTTNAEGNSYNMNTTNAEGNLIHISDNQNMSGVPRSVAEEKERYERNQKKKLPELLLHTELVSVDGKETRVQEGMTHNGKFTFALPGYYGNAILFISADDSAKWNKKEKLNPSRHTWVQQIPMEDVIPAKHRSRYIVDPPRYEVRVTHPYPRFVKPYNYYQTELLQYGDSVMEAMRLQDGTTQMKEVKVGAKRRGMKRFSDSIPAFMIDAYDAYNYAIDAGMYRTMPEDIVRAFVGDYGQEYPYLGVAPPFGGNSVMDSNIHVRFGYNQVRRATHNMTMDEDSIFMRSNLKSIKPFNRYGALVINMSPMELREYYDKHRLDKYVIYTDYQPRLSGDERYYGSLLPETQIAVYQYADDSRRAVYRDRRFVQYGYNYADDFYQPNYQNRQLDEKPADYRRTLYWNPDLMLDKNGKATIKLYNNGKSGQISVSAEGMTMGGVILESKHTSNQNH